MIRKAVEIFFLERNKLSGRLFRGKNTDTGSDHFSRNFNQTEHVPERLYTSMLIYGFRLSIIALISMISYLNCFAFYYLFSY